MSMFVCARCSHQGEVAGAAASPPCPRCGTPMSAQTESAPPAGTGVFQSALDEIVERPAIRMFCNVMSSVVVHVGLFSLVAIATWLGVEATLPESQAEPTPSIAIQLADVGDGTGFRWPSKVNKYDEENGIKLHADKPVLEGWIGHGEKENEAPKLLKSALAGGVGSLGTDPTVGGLGTADSGTNPLNLIGRGPGRGGAGTGGNGGGQGNGSGGPNRREGGGEVFGVRGLPGARSIVYVVDRSGSMDNVGDFLKLELAKAINKLKSTQTFNVVWFSDGDPYALSATMVSATEDNKHRLFRHLQDVRFSGSTDPRGALFKAIELKPELIYILTDGEFEPDFVQAVTARNRGACRINAIGFVFDISSSGHTNLNKLTAENRGQFKSVEVRKLTGN